MCFKVLILSEVLLVLEMMNSRTLTATKKNVLLLIVDILNLTKNSNKA